MTTQVTTIDHALATFSCGSNGIASCVTKQIASVDGEQRGEDARAGRLRRDRGTSAEGGGRASAPTVRPKSATEIATNAKWYHMVTLKIRVSTISYISVERVTRNRPAYVPARARLVVVRSPGVVRRTPSRRRRTRPVLAHRPDCRRVRDSVRDAQDELLLRLRAERVACRERHAEGSALARGP